MDPYHPQEPILHRKQVEQKAVCVPGSDAHDGAGNSIQDEVVGGRHDGGQDDGGVDHAADDQRNALPGQTTRGLDGEGRDGQSDEKRVTEVQRGHRSVLVAEAVGGPNTALAVLAVHGIDEAIGQGLRGIGALVRGIAQQAGRHARPGCENDEGEQVAHGHRSPPPLVHVRVQPTDSSMQSRGRCALCRGLLEVLPGASRGDIVHDDQEEDRAGDVDERVGSVGPVHEVWSLEEPSLNRKLDKEMKALLEVDQLQGVSASDVDSGVVEEQGGESTAKLVDPVYERPIPSLDQKWVTTQDAAEKAVFEDLSVGRYHSLSPVQKAYRPSMPSRVQFFISLTQQRS